MSKGMRRKIIGEGIFANLAGMNRTFSDVTNQPGRFIDRNLLDGNRAVFQFRFARILRPLASQLVALLDRNRNVLRWPVPAMPRPRNKPAFALLVREKSEWHLTAGESAHATFSAATAHLLHHLAHLALVLHHLAHLTELLE